MPKNRKTRKQKKVADYRKSIAFTHIQEVAPQKERAERLSKAAILEVSPLEVKPQPSVAVSTKGYNYLFKDLLKTAVLTASILLAEILLKQLTFNT